MGKKKKKDRAEELKKKLFEARWYRAEEKKKAAEAGDETGTNGIDRTKMTERKREILDLLKERFRSVDTFTLGEAQAAIGKYGDIPPGSVSPSLTAGVRFGEVNRDGKGVYSFVHRAADAALPLPTEHSLTKDAEKMLNLLRKDPLFVQREKAFHSALSAREDRFTNVLDALPTTGSGLTRVAADIPRTYELIQPTPDECLAFRKIEFYEGDRPYRMDRVVHLHRAMSVVDLPFIWAVVKIKRNGKIYYFRVNGQHTLWLFMMAPYLVRKFTRALKVTFDCGKNERLLSEIYRAFDHPVSSRSKADRIKAAIESNPLLKDHEPPITGGHITTIISGIVEYITGDHQGHDRHITAEEMVDLTEGALAEFVLMMVFLRRSGPKETRDIGKLICRRDWVSGFFWIFQYWPEALFAFLLEVRDGVTLDGRGCSRSTASGRLTHLMMHSATLGSGKKPSTNFKVLTPEQIQGYVKAYWSAWCRGVSPSYLKSTLRAPLRKLVPETPNLPDRTASMLSTAYESLVGGLEADVQDFIVQIRKEASGG